MSDREQWLNGWPKIGNDTVLVGTATRCIGCGKYEGTLTVAFDKGYEIPEKDPDYPFDEATCPVVSHHQESVQGVDETPRIGLARMKLINAARKLPR